LYTVTKLNGLFRAPARMSVIKLILARKMIYFCGLNKTHGQPGVLQGFLKTRLLHLFPGRKFPKKFYFPSLEYSKKLVVLVPRPEFSGNIPFPSIEVLRNSWHLKARKTASRRIRSTVLLITKQMSYHYATSSDG
jgi:hypothetical protein